MEAWAIVVIILGTNIVTGLITLYVTRSQLIHSEKQLDKQLQSQKEVDSRERRREIRGQPLLQLRVELGRMASKQERLVVSAHQLHGRTSLGDEEARSELQEAANDWNTYMASGEWQQTLFTQYDIKLVELVRQILKEYGTSYTYAMLFVTGAISGGEVAKAMQVFDRNRARIAKVQSQINDRLEKL